MTAEAEASIFRSYLDELIDEKFDEALRKCLEYRDPVEETIFLTPGLAPRVAASLARARRWCRRQERNLLRELDVNALRLRHIRRIKNNASVMHGQIRLIIGTLSREAENSVDCTQLTARARAKNLLAQRHPREYLALVNQEKRRMART